MTLHIGIVACSAEGAALCYRTICAEGPAMLGAHVHPEVSMHTPSFSEYVEIGEAQGWANVGELMLASAEKLAHIGADFFICPDNTIHQALPGILDRSPKPWLHIAEVVADEARRRGFRRVAITGTRWLTQSEVYPQALAECDIECVRPTELEQEEIHRIIMDELVPGKITPQATLAFQQIFARLKTAGCDAVILGCTEIPIIMSDANSVLPTLDSTRLLARAALTFAQSATCYVCGALATSVEHVPPKCLFPKKKDLPAGTDLRMNLITVPSCELHNNAKSKDDTYLMYLCTMSVTSGSVGGNHFAHAVKRSIDANPRLAERIQSTTIDVEIEDSDTGKRDRSIIAKIESTRLHSSLEAIGRGLFFHHKNTPARGDVVVLDHFTIGLDPTLNDKLSETFKMTEALFNGAPVFGSNPSVFSYQWTDDEHGPGTTFFLRFYEESKAIIRFNGV